ncbi:hypothetical protein A6A27_36285 [Micromonospora sp. CB01531]|nr:hypothetical protein A6A27_36285 [Micromonospora sp. CB01531]
MPCSYPKHPIRSGPTDLPPPEHGEPLPPPTEPGAVDPRQRDPDRRPRHGAPLAIVAMVIRTARITQLQRRH